VSRIGLFAPACWLNKGVEHRWSLSLFQGHKALKISDLWTSLSSWFAG
jgi:hypothetical protein